MNNFLIAVMAATIRVAVNMQVSYKKVKSRGETFSFLFYIQDNWLESLIGILSGGVFAFISPAIRDLTGYASSAESIIAFGCGFSSIELLRYVKSFASSKLAPIAIILFVFSLALIGCRTDRQKYNRILKRNPAWAVTTVDTIIKEVTVSSIEVSGNSNTGIDSLEVLKALRAAMREALYKDYDSTYNNANINTKADLLAKSATSALNNAVRQRKSICVAEPVILDNDSLFLSIKLLEGKLLYNIYVKQRMVKVPTVIKSTTIPSKIECNTSFINNWKEYLIYFAAGFISACVILFLSYLKTK